jgi:hypothetical protein
MQKPPWFRGEAVKRKFGDAFVFRLVLQRGGGPPLSEADLAGEIELGA